MPPRAPGFPSTSVDFRGSGVSPPTTSSIIRASPTFSPAIPTIRRPGVTPLPERIGITRQRDARRRSRAGSAAKPRRSRSGDLGDCPTSRSANRCRGHRSAGRALRRTTLHAAEGADRDSTGRAGARRARRADGRGVLDRRRGSRLGRGQGVQRARCGNEAARHRRRRSAARARRPGRARPAGRVGERRDQRARSGDAGDRVHAGDARGPPPGLRPRDRNGRCVRPLARKRARLARADRVRRVRSGRQAARLAHLRARDRAGGPDRASGVGGRGGARSRAAITRRPRRRKAASRCFT